MVWADIKGPRYRDVDGTQILWLEYLQENTNRCQKRLATMEDEPLIITPWAEYVIATKNKNGSSRAPALTTLCSSGFINWDNVLVISSETETLKDIITSDKNGHILRANTQKDLEELSDLLLSKPLLLRVTLVHTEVASKYTADTVSIWEGDYAVILNTVHPRIKTQLQKSLNQAARYLGNKCRFCLELDLTDAVEAWYLQTIDVYSGCDDFQTTKCRQSRIFITNHVTFNHCFDCSPKWWLCFSLCWICSAPCYLLYRRGTCRDIRLKLGGKVKPIKCVRRTSTTSELRSKSSSVVNFRLEDEKTITSALKSHACAEESSYGAL